MASNPPSYSKPPPLVLASASPRRSDLLQQLGLAFSIQPQSIDETVRAGESPGAYVLRVAGEKAQAAALQAPDAVVLGADTAVVQGSRIFGKPTDRQEGLAMLGALSGADHEVLTAVCLQQEAKRRTALVHSRVRIRVITEAEARAYWDTGEPGDKAGAYAIQGLGAAFVESLQGSYSAVVGLPLCETVQLLATFGIDVWAPGRSAPT